MVLQNSRYFFQIPGVFQDQGKIKELFQVCSNPVHCLLRQNRSSVKEIHYEPRKVLIIGQVFNLFVLIPCILVNNFSVMSKQVFSGSEQV